MAVSFVPVARKTFLLSGYQYLTRQERVGSHTNNSWHHWVPNIGREQMIKRKARRQVHNIARSDTARHFLTFFHLSIFNPYISIP